MAKRKAAKARRTHDDAFKAEVVRRYREEGGAKRLARELGIAASLVTNWAAGRGFDGARPTAPANQAPARAARANGKAITAEVRLSGLDAYVEKVVERIVRQRFKRLLG